LRFTTESVDKILIVAKLRTKQLYGNLSMQHDVSRFVHNRHSTAANLTF
jgi:hypothetical protein